MTNSGPLLETNTPGGIRRRSFIKWGGVAGGTAAAFGMASRWGLLGSAEAAGPIRKAAEEKILWSSCNVNCGSRCPLRMHVVDGQIVRVETDNTGDDELGSQQIRACVRGRSIRERVYNPDRLKYPMKRTGKRGSGEFQRITWDEAFDAIAAGLKKVLDKYGNEAVYLNYSTGIIGGTMEMCYGPVSFIGRLMTQLGGFLNFYADYSTAQITAAYPYIYGGFIGSNSFDDAVNSKLVVLWGNNPHETRMSGGGETFVTQKVKRLKGTRVIVIDPRYTDTAVTIADEWVPVRPNTDAALAAGLAHVMISEGLHDQRFLDTYCVGFDEAHMPEGVPANSSYKSYILGLGPDGIEKTPEWAARVSGVPAATIVRLAREIAQAKPCMITQGWGPQRHQNGDRTSRAIFTIAAMTGNIGISGGGNGGRESYYALPLRGLPPVENPVKTSVSNFNWYDAIVRGPEMTATADGIRGKDKLDVPIKFIWNYAGNCLTNQHGDINRMTQILSDESLLEMIVVIENHMTPSAKFADILLPGVSTPERMDLVGGESAGNLGYAIFDDQVIEPLWECKTIYEITSEIAKRMGIGAKFTEGKTYEQWLRQVVAENQKAIPGFPGFDELRQKGIFKQKNPAGSVIPMKEFRDDPKKNPLKTPSGKIEIFSKQLLEISQTWTLPEGDKITALPEYVATPEGPEDPLRAKYPLQCIGHHYKARTHSTYANVGWLREAHPQMVWINPVDAKARGVEDGDTVHVWNDRGKIRIVAKVTPRIAPGVVSVPQGAWYQPDKHGVDIGGCVNTLVALHPTPLAKGNGSHTVLVQIEKA